MSSAPPDRVKLNKKIQDLQARVLENERRDVERERRTLETEHSAAETKKQLFELMQRVTALEAEAYQTMGTGFANTSGETITAGATHFTVLSEECVSQAEFTDMAEDQIDELSPTPVKGLNERPKKTATKLPDKVGPPKNRRTKHGPGKKATELDKDRAALAAKPQNELPTTIETDYDETVTNKKRTAPPAEAEGKPAKMKRTTRNGK